MLRGDRARGARSRLARRLLVMAAVAAGALAALARRRRADIGPAQLPTSPTGAPAAGGPVEEVAPQPASAAGTAGPPERGRTREELYRQAQAIDLKGRSRMTKAQLQRALREHGIDG